MPSNRGLGLTFNRGREGKCVSRAMMAVASIREALQLRQPPVDIFYAVGSRTEYTSAPACFVGPCPRTCTDELGCGETGLVCRKGICVKP